MSTKLNKSLVNYVSRMLQPVSALPKDATRHQQALSKSNRLMLDMGIIRQSYNGVYHLLPLGLRSLNKLKNLIRCRMNQIGAQELKMPLIVSADLWKKSGRWDPAGEEIFKLNDRHKKAFLLSPTNEESAADLISTIRQLPQKSFPLLFYQINTKFRDELRPRCGLIRAREFVMKDLYSFDTDEKKAHETYQTVGKVYDGIFSDLGLNTLKVAADPGEIKGIFSHEYHIECIEGEEVLNSCKKCGLTCIQHDWKECSNCKHGELSVLNGLEVGHTFFLGTTYSDPLSAVFKLENNQMKPLMMGSYGLGVTRILASSIEVLSNEEEIRWPLTIAPYRIVIIPPKEGSKESSSAYLQYEIYDILNSQDHLKDDILIDDRQRMTIGKRIIHAKMTGYPFIIVIGSKSLQNPPIVEVIDVYNDTSYDFTLDKLTLFYTNEFQRNKQSVMKS